MARVGRWWRPLVTIGLVGMVIGALDPLEGSLLIVPATALVAVGAGLGHSRERVRLYWALVLVAVGVGLMWGMSAIGGLGGSTGRSMWWALVLLPYPVGWIMGLIYGVRARLQGASPPPTPAAA